MKHLVSFFAFALFFLASSCADNGANAPSMPAGSSADLGKVLLAFLNAPDNVARVVARISRDGYSDRILVLVVADSGASGSFTDIAVGTWHLRVDAENDSGSVLYTGQADVDVFPGQISHVSLHLQATTGGIEIEVTWGNTSSCIPPASGLVSWWTADGSALDHSGLNNGLLLNGATFEPGRVGQAFKFDGLDDYFAATTNNFPTGNQNRTIELWVKISSFPFEESFIAGYGDFDHARVSYALGTSNRALFVSNFGEAVLGSLLDPGRWYHVAVTNMGNVVTLYLDGEPVATGNLSINTPTSAPFYSGKIPNTSGNIRRLNGFVDEIGIYNRALTGNEIRSIFLAGSVGKCR